MMNIDDVNAQLHEATPEVLQEQIINFWGRMAAELTYVIGGGGFRSLFLRSIVLANARFPYMEKFRFAEEGESQFLHLKECFEGRDIADIQKAHILILFTFTETLSSLIGEPLATSILRPVFDESGPTEMERGTKLEEENRK